MTVPFLHVHWLAIAILIHINEYMPIEGQFCFSFTKFIFRWKLKVMPYQSLPNRMISLHYNSSRVYFRQSILFWLFILTAREESTRYLLERGAPAGVFDQSGLSAVALLIEKLPKVAHEALQQFVTIDRAFRKEYYYLSYLESDPAEWKDLEAMKKHKKEMRKDGIKVKLCPTTPLKVTKLQRNKFVYCCMFCIYICFIFSYDAVESPLFAGIAKFSFERSVFVWSHWIKIFTVAKIFTRWQFPASKKFLEILKNSYSTVSLGKQ